MFERNYYIMNELTEKDRQLLIKKGISEEILEAQIAQFKQGNSSYTTV